MHAGLQQIAARYVTAEELCTAIGAPLFKRLRSAAKQESGRVKTWLQARTQLFMVVNRQANHSWAVGLRERVSDVPRLRVQPESDEDPALLLSKQPILGPEPEPESEPDLWTSPLVLPPPPQPRPLPPQPHLNPLQTPLPPSLPPPECTDEDMGELRTYLQEMGYSRYEKNFIQHQINFDTLLLCEEQDLAQIGIAKGPRVKIMKTARSWRKCPAEKSRLAASQVVHSVANNVKPQPPKYENVTVRLGPQGALYITNATATPATRESTMDPDTDSAFPKIQHRYIKVKAEKEHSMCPNDQQNAGVTLQHSNDMTGQSADMSRITPRTADPQAMRDSTVVPDTGLAPASIQPNTEHRSTQIMADDEPDPESNQNSVLQLSEAQAWQCTEPLVSNATSNSPSDFSWQQQQWVSAPAQPMVAVQKQKPCRSNSTLLGRLRTDAYVGVVRDREVRRILFDLVKLITDKKRAGTRKRDATGTPMQAAAKFFCAYIFKEFTDGIRDVETEAQSDCWNRVGGYKDPLIPASAVAWPTMRDDFSVLVKKYWSPSKAAVREVTETFVDLLSQWKAAAKRVQDASTHPKASRVVVRYSIDQADSSQACLSCCVDGAVWKTLQIQTVMLTMLRERYNRYAPQLDGAQGNVDESDDDTFFTVVFNMQLRYESLANFDQGNQGALPHDAFQVLREEFNVCHECFASPLNVCTGACEQTFNTLFQDTDKYFGSQGSFFEFWPMSGSYEVNPPFDKNSVQHTFQHICDIMQKDDGQLPLLFIVITPFVTTTADDFLLRKTELRANQHYFTKGFAHRKLEKHIQDRRTSICFIGNDAARSTWTICDKVVQKLENAFSLRHPNGTSR